MDKISYAPGDEPLTEGEHGEVTVCPCGSPSAVREADGGPLETPLAHVAQRIADRRKP